jgi:hypothetical protein
MHRGVQCDYDGCPRYQHGDECFKPDYKLCKMYPIEPKKGERNYQMLFGFVDE